MTTVRGSPSDGKLQSGEGQGQGSGGSVAEEHPASRRLA
jgi:hypothetical protein